jgi:hypothetical protein
VDVGLYKDINLQVLLTIKKILKNKYIWIKDLPNKKYNFSRLKGYLCENDDSVEFVGTELEISDFLFKRKILKKLFCDRHLVFNDEYFVEF